jgi:cytochrome c-type biogenesis protein CcmH
LFVFWIVVVIMLGAALAFIVPPLLREGRSAGVGREEANIAVYRDRRAQLARAHGNGELDAEAYEEACRELEVELLAGTHAAPAAEVESRKTHPAVAVVVAIVVPVAAFGLYLVLGSPAALLMDRPGAATRASAAPRAAGDPASQQAARSVEEMVDGLAKRLQANPEDANGWLMLGRSYAAMNRLSEARAALREAEKRRPEDPPTLVALAEVEAGINGNNLAGRPAELIKRALEYDPNFPQALWLAGFAALHQGDSAAAVGYWERILAQGVLADEDAERIRQAIAQARGAPPVAALTTPAKEAEPSASGGARVAVKVSIAPELESKVSSGDALFVFARAAEGPRMPLAIVRKSATELPLEVSLDDSMAMSPQMKLSTFPSVVVGARVSRSGDAIPQSGDLSGVSAVVSPSQGTTVNVVIDQVVQ